jgi:hypothetical protein
VAGGSGVTLGWSGRNASTDAGASARSATAVVGRGIAGTEVIAGEVTAGVGTDVGAGARERASRTCRACCQTRAFRSGDIICSCGWTTAVQSSTGRTWKSTGKPNVCRTQMIRSPELGRHLISRRMDQERRCSEKIGQRLVKGNQKRQGARRDG